MILLAIEDITERRQLKSLLEVNEAKYRELVQNANSIILKMDPEGKVTFFNEFAQMFFGYTEEEMLGRSVVGTIVPETGSSGLDPDFMIKDIGINPEKYITNENENMRRNGERVWVAWTNKAIRDGNGKVIEILCIGNDITERRRLEILLSESEERYRRLFETANDAIVLLEKREGNITHANPATEKMLGYSLKESIGNKLQDIGVLLDMSDFQTTMQNLNMSGIINYNDVPIKTKSGQHIDTDIYLVDRARLVQCNIRDITERKRAEDALKKNREELIKKNQEIEESRKNTQLTLERLGAAYEELKTTQAKIIQQEKMASIGLLAAGVAHEINNPMAFIASNLGTLDKYIRRLKDFIQAQSEAIKSFKTTDAIKKLEKKRKELKLDYTINDIDLLVKESRDGSERVQKIVQGLNRFSRVDDAEYKDANINECIESSINIVWNELQHKATLHKDYGNLPPTKCYPQKLNQVFINLLINAIQAIEKKGKITIKTWEKDGSIWVTVFDTGCGIPRENQSKIFEPFFTTKEVGMGTGLGLSISYEIMQRHKGEISFESKEGKGTTFTIRIPVV
jgi:two-component system NtrC family sensor kinase